MRCSILLCLFGLVTVMYARPNVGTYPDKYDNMNIREIINNPRFLIPYIKCLLDLGRCTSEGKLLKSHIKQALEENCARCTAAQRNGTDLVLGHLINHEPDYWRQLKAKYDSSGKYLNKLEKNLRLSS